MRSFSQLWPTLKRLLAYGSPWRKPLGIAVLMMWVAAAAEVSGPLLISYFIDNMVAKNNLPLKVVAGLAAAYVGLQLFAAGLHYAQSLLFNRAAVGVVQQLRTDVMDAALRQPLSEFDTQPVGQVISRVTNDTEVIRDLYVTVVATVLRSAALVGAMLVAMFSLDWRMALVAIMIFPVVLVVMVIYQRYSTPIVRRVRAYLADINDGFNEIINGMSVIQQFRQQARFGERMGEASRSHYMARMQTLRLDGFLLRPLLSLFSSLILCGLLMLFGFSASGTIEVGVLYAFISYLGRLNEPLIELTTQQAMLQQAVVAGERVFELMDGPRQQYGNDDRPLQSGTIEVDNVPPMHSVASPSVLSRACMACNSVTRIRAPLAPIGCPSAMAPPLTFTFSESKPRFFPTARNCAANASLASMRSISASCSPASCNAFCVAGTGPIPINAGGTPPLA